MPGNSPALRCSAHRFPQVLVDLRRNHVRRASGTVAWQAMATDAGFSDPLRKREREDRTNARQGAPLCGAACRTSVRTDGGHAGLLHRWTRCGVWGLAAIAATARNTRCSGTALVQADDRHALQTTEAIRTQAQGVRLRRTCALLAGRGAHARVQRPTDGTVVEQGLSAKGFAGVWASRPWCSVKVCRNRAASTGLHCPIGVVGAAVSAASPPTITQIGYSA